VRGTVFEVETGDESETTVKTHEGAVAVMEKTTQKEVLVEGGKQTKASKGSPPETPQPIVEPEKEEEKEPEKEEKREQEKQEKIEPEQETKQPEKEEVAEKESKKILTAVNGSIGADVLSDPDNPGEQKIYYNLSLAPVFSFWKFNIGLNFELYFDEEGNVREQQWDEWDDMIEKIQFIEFGNPEDPFSVLLGGLDSYSLGHGFVVRRYTNMLNYPDIKRIGTRLNLNFAKTGMESFVSDIEEFSVFGSRLYYKPFETSGIPIVKDLEFGGSFVSDINPDQIDDTDDGVYFYGGDIEIGLFDNFGLSSSLYADYVTYSMGPDYDFSDYGSGKVVGLGGDIISLIDYNFEYRRIDNNFVPAYFNTFYQINRSTRPSSLTRKQTPEREGPYIKLGTNLFDAVEFSFAYENYNGGKIEGYPYLHGNLIISPALTMNKVGIKVSYDKEDVFSFDDFKELNGAVMTTEISYAISPTVNLIIVNRQTYDQDGEPTRTMSLRTGFIF
ncbi:MAG: hypothetical protein ACOC5R_03130, partial [Elusimicrobiota bacterium]